jgi:hypothetical protein
VESLDTCGFKGTKLILYNNVDDATIRELKRRGYLTVGFRLRFQMAHSLVRERYYQYWNVIRQLPDTRYVLHTDMRDLVFQSDPFEWVEENIGDNGVVVGSEAILIKDEGFNRNTMIEVYGDEVYQEVKDKLVYCSGIIAGKAKEFSEFCLMTYWVMTELRCQTFGCYIDQAAVQVLAHASPLRDMCKTAHAEDGWVLHLAPRTQPKNKGLMTEPDPIISEDGTAFTSIGKKYAMLHQYDRASNLKAIIEAKYGASLSCGHSIEKKPKPSGRNSATTSSTVQQVS